MKGWNSGRFFSGEWLDLHADFGHKNARFRSALSTMEVEMSVKLQGAWGRVGSIDDAIATDGPGIVMRFDWVPGREIRSRLPYGQRLSFAVMRDQNGFHRVVPAGGVEPFLLNAALVGQTVCERTGLFDEDRVKACDFDRLLFQQRTRINEAIHWHPKSSSCLQIVRSGRLTTDGGDVLPDGLGIDQNNRDRRWTVAEFIRHGGDQATLLGIEAPDYAAKIRCGLIYAALRAPFHCETMSSAELQGMPRLILFCNDYEKSTSEVSAEADQHFERVHEKIRRAVWPHLMHDTEQFNRWFYEESDILIGQVAKQKRGGGPVSRDVVREIRLRMILDAHQSIAACLHVAMEDVRLCMPIELTENEATYFNLLYRRQSNLGGLSLMLLRDSLKLIELDPITSPIELMEPGVLLKVLHLYAEMTLKRRIGYQRDKRADGVKERAVADTAKSSCTDDGEELTIQNQLLAMPALIIESLDLRCHCDEGNSIGVIESREISDHEVTFLLSCDDCKWQHHVTLTPELQSDLADRLETV